MHKTAKQAADQLTPEAGCHGAKNDSSAILADGENRGGAPKGNANRVTHGLHSLASSGRVPLKMRGGHHLRRALRRMRAELVAELTATRGREPTVFELALLNSATRHEARARLAERYLAMEHEAESQTTHVSRVVPGGRASMVKKSGLTVMERVAILEAIGRATDARDRALRALGLDVLRERSPWESLKLIPAATPCPTHHAPRQRTQDDQHGPEVIPAPQ